MSTIRKARQKKSVLLRKIIKLIIVAQLFLFYQTPAFSGEISHIYDDLGRLSSTSYQDGYTITQITYNYDSTGNPETRQVAIQIQDSDGDGMPDGWEIQYGLDPDDASDADLDTDGDGLTNLEEYSYGTDPELEDTDGDGYSDNAEISTGSSPTDLDSYPSAEPVSAAGTTGIGLLFGALAGLGVFSNRRSGAL